MVQSTGTRASIRPPGSVFVLVVLVVVFLVVLVVEVILVVIILRQDDPTVVEAGEDRSLALL